MATTTVQKKTIWNKHFPTVLGLGVLVVALVAGIILVGGNTNVFSPRATPQTTPKNIQLTNVGDSSFTVSFITDEAVAGFIKYGTQPGDLSQQASDDRDQLTGTVGTFTTHHITLRGLQPNTQYYYKIGTGTDNTFDNEGTAYSVQTFNRSGTPTAAQTAYGTILDASGSPAVGSVVYVNNDGIEPLSTLVKDSGSWAIPLSNARTADGSFADLSLVANLNLMVQGISANTTLTHQVPLSATQPVETLTFGQTPTLSGSTAASVAQTDPSVVGIPSDQTVATNSAVNPDDLSASGSSQVSSLLSRTAVANTGGLGDVLDTTGVIDLVKLEEASASGTPEVPALLTTTPVIKGVAAPRTKVTISVHSETQIEQEVITDENGEFILDLSELQQGLEPGDHTVTYSYIDPSTGQEVTKTHNFTVAGSAGLLAQANTGSTTNTTGNGGPYGSGNPFPVGGTPTPTASLSATPRATASASASATPSATPRATNSGVTYPATGSGIPVSGSTGTTVALVLGGLLFLLAGSWSYYLAQKASEEE